MKKLFPALIFAVVVVYLIYFSWFGSFTDYESTFYGTRMQDAAEINALYHLDMQPSVLYLEPGDAPYFIHANSSCRYIAPLPLIRYRDNWNLSNLPQYWQTYYCVADYQGEYIVMEQGGDKALDWFGESQQVRAPLVGLIKENYTVVYNKSWRVWERKEWV